MNKMVLFKKNRFKLDDQPFFMLMRKKFFLRRFMMTLVLMTESGEIVQYMAYIKIC